MVLIDYTSTADPISGQPFGSRAGQVTMIQPVTLDPNKKKKYRLIRCILTPEIPNVYAYGNFNNTQIRISNNGGSTWSIIQFPNGIYTISMIQDTITSSLLTAGWIASSSNTPIIVNYNPATRLVYVILNSSLLSSGTQVAVDFGYTVFYQMLGYATPATAKFTTDGTFSAPNPPNLDVQGTYVNIVSNLINGCRYSNGTFSNIIARIPLVTTSSQVEIVFPSAATGLISPEVPCSIGNSIMSFNIDIQSPSGQSLVVLYGNYIVELEINDV